MSEFGETRLEMQAAWEQFRLRKLSKGVTKLTWEPAYRQGAQTRLKALEKAGVDDACLYYVCNSMRAGMGRLLVIDLVENTITWRTRRENAETMPIGDPHEHA